MLIRSTEKNVGCFSFRETLRVFEKVLIRAVCPILLIGFPGDKSGT